jgi:hypothetical protein
MAHAPEIRLPVKADTAPVIAVIGVIVKHLTALRDDLAALGEPQETVHACPFDGEQVTPCCHRTPFDLPRGDKITTDHKTVTCRGGA